MAHSLVDDEIQSCIESAEPITIMLPRHQTPGRRKLNMKKKIVLTVIAAVAMALSLAGCGVDISSIGLPSDVVIEKGETQQLQIEYSADDKATEEKIAEAAEKLTLEWTSSNEDVATVDENGMVTAVGAGEADITASIKDANISSTTHVKVVILPTDVDAPDALELYTNGENEKELNAKIVPEDATEVKLAYTSSDEGVATVDENGLVTAVADGECTITAYIVADVPVTAETATQETAAVVVNTEDETANTEAEASDSDAVATMPEDLADVDSAFGVVPDGLSATTKVTVSTKVEKIELDKTEGILYVGNSVTVNAAVTPDNATDTTVTWSSSDESVATVDETGKITAVATGNATITATSNSDADVNATYDVTVEEKKAPTYTSNKTNYGSSASGSVAAGGSATVTTPTVPAAPAPDPTPVQPSNPEPAPAPAPAPAEPAPAPAEPSQPSGGDGGSSGGYDIPHDPNGQPGSGIDWTQDNSNGDNQTCEFGCT